MLLVSQKASIWQGTWYAMNTHILCIDLVLVQAHAIWEKLWAIENFADTIVLFTCLYLLQASQWLP